MKKLFVLVLSFCLLYISAQNSIGGIEYWFNNAYQLRSTQYLTSSEMSIVAKTDALENGVNIIHVQVFDADMKYSAPVSGYFFKNSSSAFGSSKISGYRYWFNNDYENAVTTNFTPSATFIDMVQIDAFHLPDGLNILNIKYCDNLNKWSSAVSKLFIKTSGSSSENKRLSTLQYWIDNDFNNAVSLDYHGGKNELVLTNIDFSSITDGLHTFHLRLIDDSGGSSAVLSSHFVKSPTNNFTNGIAGFQYWLDSDFSASQNIVILNSPMVLNANYEIDFSYKPIGKVYFNYRFVDNKGLWSVVNTQEINRTVFTAYEAVLLTNEVKIYPNPVTDFLKVEFTGNQPNTMIELRDLSGKIIKKLTQVNTTQDIDLRGIKSGFYFLKLVYNQNYQTYRLIKK